MPAALQLFDAREWAVPGEEPSEAAWGSQVPGTAGADWYRCHSRYIAAVSDWFDVHPEADFLVWLNTKRARRRAS